MSADAKSSFESCIQSSVQGTVFVCNKCDHQTRLFRPTKVELFACPKCCVIHSRTNTELYRNIHNSRSVKSSRDLPGLGKTGVLNGRSYTVIGIADKTEQKNRYAIWKEIVLIDDLGAIHFLNCSYGNYTLVSEDGTIDGNSLLTNIADKVEVNGHRFRHLSSYYYKTTFALGEFHYDCVDVKDVHCHDFISPPYYISLEQTKEKHITAFSGRHLSRKEVAEMFNDDRIRWQDHEGVGVAQPFYGGINVRRFAGLSAIFLGVLLIALITLSGGKKQQYLSTQMSIPSGDSTLQFVSRPFIVDSNRRYSFLSADIYCMLNSEWVEAGLTMVNEETGEEREFSVGTEHYSGVSGGYDWEEGSDFGTSHLSGVSPGKYHVKGTIYHPAFPEERVVTLTLRQDSVLGWNFGIIFLPYLIFIFILLIANRQFDRMRTGQIDTLFG